MGQREKIGSAQLEVLRYVQDHHPVTVRQVASYLAETRGLTRTTALNVMERLREKGHLRREAVEGVFQYSPVQSKVQLLRGLVRDFVEHALQGSLEPFVAYLAEEVDLSDEELEQLRKKIRELPATNPEEKP